jgi:hypothetical protein
LAIFPRYAATEICVAFLGLTTEGWQGSVELELEYLYHTTIISYFTSRYAPIESWSFLKYKICVVFRV